MNKAALAARHFAKGAKNNNTSITDDCQLRRVSRRDVVADQDRVGGGGGGAGSSWFDWQAETGARQGQPTSFTTTKSEPESKPIPLQT